MSENEPACYRDETEWESESLRDTHQATHDGHLWDGTYKSLIFPLKWCLERGALTGMLFICVHVVLTGACVYNCFCVHAYVCGSLQLFVCVCVTGRIPRLVLFTNFISLGAETASQCLWYFLCPYIRISKALTVEYGPFLIFFTLTIVLQGTSVCLNIYWFRAGL